LQIATGARSAARAFWRISGLAKRRKRFVQRRRSGLAKRRKRFVQRRRRLATERLREVIRQARQLQEIGDRRAALAACERAPSSLRQDVKLLSLRGKLLQELGLLNAAHDIFAELLASKPERTEAWKQMGIILRDLGRRDELPAFIDAMLATIPRTSANLMTAAALARDGRFQDLADRLFAEALSTAPNAATILKAARILLAEGEQGRVIHLLDKNRARLDGALDAAQEIGNRAMAQLRLAGWTGADRPVGTTERADVIAVQSILERTKNIRADHRPAPRGLAIVSNSLGPGGIEMQVIHLIRRLRSAAGRFTGPIYLLLVARPNLAPEFHKANLAGLDITVEYLHDFDVDVGKAVPVGIAEQLGVLPPTIFARTAYLIDRLRAHKPEGVLALSERTGVAAMLAASITGGAHVVISARGEPPRVRGTPDRFLKHALRAGLARNKVSLVANSIATARDFAEWLALQPGCVQVSYDGLDVDALLSQRDPAATAAHRRVLAIRDDQRVVGSIFNARGEKRPHLWMEAAALIAQRAPDIVFVVVGGGHMENDACTTLSQFGLDGRFHRPGVRRDIATWLELMDVVLLTSRNEGTPNVLLEAQALGRPVVATAVGGNAETFIPEKTGILLPANPSAEEVADAVLRVLGDRSFVERARAQAPWFIRQNFCDKRMTAEFLDLCFDRNAPHRASSGLLEA
jgi:glycosyltransferase involved in cell wall biosynthesis